jgi:chemotaxis methyl-accepting protein methylase
VPQVRLWSAGTASGEEAYSLAILLLEHAEREGCRARLRDFRVLATDIDRRTLDAARRAEYRELAFSETPDAVRERWFERQGGWRPRREVRELVEFRPQDLIMEPYPARQHLILCRNVIIYFERVVQTAIFERFREALVPGGFLVLGKVESLLGGPAAGFEPVSQRDRVFRKR